MTFLPASRMLAEIDLPGSRGRGQQAEPARDRPCKSCRLDEQVAAAEALAYARGVEDGRQRAAAEHLAALQGAEARALEEAVRGEARLAEALANKLTAEIGRARDEIAAAGAGLMAEFLRGRVESEALSALAQSLREALEDRIVSEVRLSGPAGLVDRFRQMLSELPCPVTMAVAQAPDIRIIIDELVLETAMAQWVSVLEATP